MKPIRMTVFAPGAVAFAVLASCARTPMPAAPSTVAALTMRAASEMLIGTSTQAAVDATGEDGVPLDVRGTWDSDAPAVARVDQQGLITAVSPGAATISFLSQGRAARQQVIVRPDYTGVWSGHYAIDNCFRSGVRSDNPCDVEFVQHGDWTFQLTLTQDRGVLRGQLVLGGGGAVDPRLNPVFETPIDTDGLVTLVAKQGNAYSFDRRLTLQLRTVNGRPTAKLVDARYVDYKSPLVEIGTGVLTEFVRQ